MDFLSNEIAVFKTDMRFSDTLVTYEKPLSNNTQIKTR